MKDINHSNLLVFSYRVGVKNYLMNFNIVQGSVISINRLSLHQVQRFKPINHLNSSRLYPAEGCILFVEFRHSVVSDEELTAISIGSTVGHRQDASAIVSDAFDEFVFERFSVDALALFACA